MTSQERHVADYLKSLGISFIRYEHPPVATAEAAERYWSAIDAFHTKNLFLRNQKGTRHYLAVIQHLKRADLRAVADQVGDGRFSFASPERLMTHLGLTPGSVSPFGLINDEARDVHVLLDEDVKAAKVVSFHPNINTATITLTREDFLRFLEARGNPVQYVTFSS